MGEYIMGQITQIYSPKTEDDNYTVYIQGSEGTSYRVYVPECNYRKDDIVEIESADKQTSKKTGKIYYETNSISLFSGKPKTNGHTEPTRQPINSTSSTLSKDVSMLVTGIWTRSVTSNKTPEQVAAHADAALAYMKKLGGNDEPFNDQFW